MSDWKTQLITGKQELPPRICIFGGHGIGKSTIASQFPKPIFISTEDGLASLDVVSFPRAETVDDVAQNIRTLVKEDHDFKTVVLDSVDWLVEPLITGDIESKHDAKELAYGKGQMMIAEAFRELLSGFDVLRKKRDMNVVLIAHSSIVRYEDPRSEPYDRYQPKLPNRCNALLQEWVDVLAFAGFRIIVKKSDVGFNNSVTRGITTGERLLHMIENPAYVAKNRYNCPDTVPMVYEKLIEYVPVKN
jgi:hypothetical protein